MILPFVITITLAASVLSGILYRMGGAKGFNTKFRDIGCPLVFLGLVWALFGLKPAFWWAYVITLGLSWGALSTYWDWLFGYDNFYFHGLCCGLAGLVLIAAGVPWWLLAIRVAVSALCMGLWSKWNGNDVIEEIGRGVFFIL